MAKARGVSNREFNAIEKRAKQLNKNLDGIGRGVGRSLAAPLAGVVGALSVREVIRYADAWKQAGNALKVSGVPADQLAGTLDRLFNIAQGAGADLGSTVTLFSRLSQSAKELGADQEQLFKFTKGVGDALKVAGTDANSAKGALLQLSQALGGAVVRAEEFNSINEGARPILQAVADGLDEAGGSVAKLRELVLAGEVTSKVFFSAFLKGSQGLAQQAAQASTTFGQAFQKIENAFTRYIGQTDEGLGASQRLIQGLEALADNFDATADTAIAFASILAAGLLGRSIGKMIANIGLAGAALVNLTRQIRAAQAAARGGILLGGLGSVAGPIGAAIGVAAAAALYFASSTDKASASGKRYADVLAEIEGAAEKTGEAVEGAADKITEKRKNEIAADLELATEKANEARKAVVDLFDHLLRSIDRTNLDKGVIEQFEKMRDRIAAGEATADEVRQALYQLANDNYQFQNVADAFQPVLTTLENAIKALDVFQQKAKAVSQAMPSFRQAETESLNALGRMNAERDAFLGGRMDEARRSSDQKALEDRTEQIMKAAQEAGIALTDGAARLQAASEIAAENLVKSTEASAGDLRKSLIDTAKRFSGFNENVPTQRNALSDFFKAANQNVDPKITAWCAAFVNAVLATNGLPGTGRLNARSFLDYGTPTQDPQPGDLVILKRGSGNVQGHVGFFMGNAEGGGVRVLGGNQGNEVNERTFRSEDVLGFRQVPGGVQSEGLQNSVNLRREQLQIIRETMAALQEETASIEFERGHLTATNAERERERVIRETLLELQRQGVELTPEIIAGVEAEANARYGAVAAYDAAVEAAERLRQKQEELQYVQQEIAGAFQGAIKGLISDLVQGKSATEALTNAVARLADRLLDIALNQLFASLFGGGLGGGGGLFKLFGFAQGGIASHGRPRPLPRYAGGGVAKSAAIFGEAGPEAAVPLPDGRRIPVDLRLPNLTNLAARGQQAAAPQVETRTTVVNTFDAQSFLSQALSSQEGVKVILNAVRAQPAAFRAAIGGAAG